MDRDARKKRIVAHADLPGQIAWRLARRLPAHVNRGDLTSAGMLGLIEAADRYREEHGVPFGAYARTRVAGAMIDALRAEQLGPRRSGAAHISLVELEEDAVPRTEPAGFAAVALRQDRERLREAMSELDEREQRILALHYEQELTQREIGSLLGVTESRVCQLLRTVHKTLRRKLESAGCA